jgi:transposase-like protein
MNPRELFCPNMDCPARGQVGKGNFHTHSLKEKRCICTVCGQTFTTTAGTIFYRLRHAPELVIQVITLLAYGCPIQAIVKAFGLDERTVCEWHRRAGQHCQQIHEHLVESSQHDLQQVQADEIKVKTQRGTFWMALAIWVPTRLWMGGVVSPKRDLELIQALADKVRNMA